MVITPLNVADSWASDESYGDVVVLRRKQQHKPPKKINKNQLSLLDWVPVCKQVLSEEAKKLGRDPWTTREIEMLHIRLLELSLYDLKMKRRGWNDILRWVNKPMDKMPAPFSFQACCWFEGVEPETMQELLLMEVGHASA